MNMRHAALAEIVRRDPRYAYEAYEFVFAALANTQRMFGRLPASSATGEAAPHHVSGRELMEGVCDLAVREFGLMAATVFRRWGIARTDDFGEIVFNLIEAGLMSKTAEDSRQDFHDLFDLEATLAQNFKINPPEEEA